MRRRWNRGLRLAVLAAALVALAAPGAQAGVAQGGVVTANPSNISPQVRDGAVYAVAVNGDRVYVGGQFTQVRNGGNSTFVNRTNLFAFSLSTGLVDTTFSPSVNGRVTGISVAADGSIYIGGRFTTVNGASKRGVARLTAGGATVPAFAGVLTNGIVNDLALSGNRVYVTGSFTAVNGTTRQKLAALDATTGAPVSSFSLALTDPRQGTAAQGEKVAISPDGSRLVVIGNFTKVSGVDRAQVVVIDLTGPSAVVAPWKTTGFVFPCADVFDTYMRDVDISPDGTYMVIGTTGAYRAPPSLCDSVSRWPLQTTSNSVQPTWVEYTGGDTYYSVNISDQAIYVGGHERWQNNPYASDAPGPGAVDRPGIGALDPLTGIALSWNPTRDRGVGVFAMVTTPTHLFAGSDTQNIGGEFRPRLGIFPLAGGFANPAPLPTALPVELRRMRPDGGLVRTIYDGTAAGGADVVGGPGVDGIDWSQVRGAFVQRGNLYYGQADGNLYRRSIAGDGTLGTPTNLTAGAGYVTAAPMSFDTVTSLAYDNGKIFYTRSGDSRILSRRFSIQSGIVGAIEYTSATGANAIRGMDVLSGAMHLTTSDGQLLRADLGADGAIDLSAPALVLPSSNGLGLGTDGDFFSLPTTDPVPPTDPDPNACPTGQWAAAYYAGRDPGVGTALLNRCEGAIDYDWGNGSPDPAVPEDTFSTRWQGVFDFGQGGEFQLSATSDDGIRVRVDGVTMIDRWVDRGPTTDLATFFVQPGIHEVVVDYYENGGGAVARVSWTAASPVSCADAEWKAEYFRNNALTGRAAITRCEPGLVFDWGGGGPAGLGVSDDFSARFSGNLDVDVLRPYRFTVTVDDGVRVFIDGTLEFESWVPQAPTTYSFERQLTPGRHAIVVEYNEYGGGAYLSYGSEALTPIVTATLIVADPNLLHSSEVALRSRIQALGYQVTTADDNTVTAASLVGSRLAMISGRVSAGAIGTRLNAATTPIINNKAWIWDDMRMSATATNQFGTLSSSTLDVIAPASILAQGRSGTISAFTSAQLVGWGTPTASAEVAYQVQGRASVFAYRTGQTLSDGSPAAGCRVAIPLDASTPNTLTADGWSIVDGALQWVAANC